MPSSPTLSEYFPDDTAYFYGYPAGESGFYNLVPPDVEELVSARPLVCAGLRARVVAFSGAARRDMLDLLRETGADTVPEDLIIRLPERISAEVTGKARNDAVVAALAAEIPDGSLVMAQPFDAPALETKYRIPVRTALSLNDKGAMRGWVPEDLLPGVLASFDDGAAFARARDLPLPCVVKLRHSSSGDGVRICRTAEDVARAQAAFRGVEDPVFAEEYVEAADNVGVQFGIPHDPDRPIDVIGLSRQVVSPQGEFLGGIAEPGARVPPDLEEALRERVLPAVRARGWYGIGGVDVLRGTDGRWSVIDPNLRMTGMTAAVLAAVREEDDRSMLSMTARFRGAEREFLRLARGGTAGQIFRLFAVRRDEDGLHANGALLFDQQETLRENALLALRAGFDSELLRAAAAGSITSSLRP